MFCIGGNQGQAVFRGRGRNKGIPGTKSIGKGIFLDVNAGPMADVFCKGRDGEMEGF
jgi:hypothetical protein